MVTYLAKQPSALDAIPLRLTHRLTGPSWQNRHVPQRLLVVSLVTRSPILRTVQSLPRATITPANS